MEEKSTTFSSGICTVLY